MSRSLRVRAKELLRQVVDKEKTADTEEYPRLHSLRVALESFLKHEPVKVLRWPREKKRERDQSMIPFMD